MIFNGLSFHFTKNVRTMMMMKNRRRAIKVMIRNYTRAPLARCWWCWKSHRNEWESSSRKKKVICELIQRFIISNFLLIQSFVLDNDDSHPKNGRKAFGERWEENPTKPTKKKQTTFLWLFHSPDLCQRFGQTFQIPVNKTRWLGK